jgi:hypothetical protein
MEIVYYLFTIIHLDDDDDGSDDDDRGDDDDDDDNDDYIIATTTATYLPTIGSLQLYVMEGFKHKDGTTQPIRCSLG